MVVLKQPLWKYGFEESTSGRVDIIEVQGDWETYDEQQRAFNDPDTDTQTYQYVDTKKLFRPVYRIKQGTEGSSVAPEVDNGWVKLAEVVIRANSSSILESDIKNITADVAGMNNTNWTTQLSATYNIGYISDVNARFRVQHNEDGTHTRSCSNNNEHIENGNCELTWEVVTPAGEFATGLEKGTLTGYRAWFCGYKNGDNALIDPTKITSAEIRDLGNSANGNWKS